MNDELPMLLISKNGSYFLYNCVNNFFYKVTKEIYAELHYLKRFGVNEYLYMRADCSSYLDVKTMIDSGMIPTRIVTCTQHLYENHVEGILNRCINQLQLQVTQDCNFSCRYCIFTRDSHVGRVHNQIEMSWDVAKRSIDFLFCHSVDSNSITIYFYGGEPLLNIELIKKAVKYANKVFSGIKISYIVTTNGSLLDDQNVSFFVENDFHIIISFDGARQIQDNHRRFVSLKSTFDIVKANIDRIRSNYPEFYNYNVKFNSVIMADENIADIRNFFQKELDKSSDSVNIINADLRGIDYYNSSVISRTLHQKDYLYDDEAKEKQMFDKIYSDKRPLSSVWKYRANCIPGTIRLFVDINGRIFPCEKVPECDSTVIGDVFSGIDLKKAKQITAIRTYAGTKCASCWAIRFCKVCICHFIDSVEEKITEDMVESACEKERKRIRDLMIKVIE